MGMYMFVSEQDRIDKRKVLGNEYLNEEFQEALKCCPSLMIDSSTHEEHKGFFKSKVLETHYNVYHETPAFDGSPYQARYQQSGSGSIEIVVAYLHGIINGYHSKMLNSGQGVQASVATGDDSSNADDNKNKQP